MFPPLQGSAKLEVEVTNLAAKAGKGMFLVQSFRLWDFQYKAMTQPQVQSVFLLFMNACVNIICEIFALIILMFFNIL